MLHLDFAGRSYVFEEFEVRLRGCRTGAEVLERIARHFELPSDGLAGHETSQPSDGEWLVRPAGRPAEPVPGVRSGARC